MPDRPTSKNRPKKKPKQNKNSLKVHHMGRAKFKPHQSLCDVWLIWCILARHLKAFSQVFGRRGCRIFGATHRQQQKLLCGTANSLWLKQSAEVQRRKKTFKLKTSKCPEKIYISAELWYEFNVCYWGVRSWWLTAFNWWWGIKTNKNRKYRELVLLV